MVAERETGRKPCAARVSHQTFNLLVEGSNPSRPTSIAEALAQAGAFSCPRPRGMGGPVSVHARGWGGARSCSVHREPGWLAMAQRHGPGWRRNNGLRWGCWRSSCWPMCSLAGGHGVAGGLRPATSGCSASSVSPWGCSWGRQRFPAAARATAVGGGLPGFQQALTGASGAARGRPLIPCACRRCRALVGPARPG